jgi:hypothetical protein
MEMGDAGLRQTKSISALYLGNPTNMMKPSYVGGNVTNLSLHHIHLPKFSTDSDVPAFLSPEFFMEKLFWNCLLFYSLSPKSLLLVSFRNIFLQGSQSPSTIYLKQPPH